jgi:outer membrane protein, heavy metal efflux system
MIAACLALAVAAPPPLRLADLLRDARERNPELKAAEAQLSAAQQNVAPSGALDDPMLTVQLWNTPVDFSSVPVMVEFAQPIALGGKRGARRDLARAEAAATEADLAARRRDIETQVASAYFDLFLADRELAVDAELETILQVLLQVSRVRVANAKAEQLELMRGQAALVQLRAHRETAVELRTSAWVRLAALVDRDPSAVVGTTTPPSVLPSLPNLATLQRYAAKERPELLQARARTVAAEAQARLARAAAVPDVTVFAAEMHAFRNPAGVSDFLFAGVRIDLPIFGGNKAGPREATAQAQLVATQQSERALKNRVSAEVAEAYAHVVGEQRQIDLHHELIPIARQVVESAEASYAAGRTDVAMALDSARELRMHEMELAGHLAMYEQRVARLQQVVGTELGLDETAEMGHDDRH